MIQLTPLYQPRVRTVLVQKLNSKSWTAEATSELCHCFAITHWNELINTATDLDDALEVVSANIYYFVTIFSRVYFLWLDSLLQKLRSLFWENNTSLTWKLHKTVTHVFLF